MFLRIILCVCLQYTHSMDWALTHLEGLKDICIHQVQINQPLPPDVLKEQSFTDAVKETEVIASGTAPSSTTTKPVHNAFSPEFLANLEEISCLNECSGQGNCVNGRLNSRLIYVK